MMDSSALAEPVQVRQYLWTYANISIAAYIFTQLASFQQVFVRIRPESEKSATTRGASPVIRPLVSTSWSSSSPRNSSNFSESIAISGCAHLIDDKTVRISLPDATSSSRKGAPSPDDKTFSFDKVFPEQASQEDIYQSVSTHVKATVRGYNTTIFAYGSTGSGKSFTMTGTSSAPGIIPRAISEIFSIIEATAAQESDVFFYVRLSYVELYNNKFRNLLEAASKDLALKERNSDRGGSSDESEEQTVNSCSHGRSTSPSKLHPGLLQRTDKIEVRESVRAGVFLAGPCLRIPVTTAQEAFHLIAKGNKVRAVGSTQCNDVSSRCDLYVLYAQHLRFYIL
jgi:Kinesin motor domain